MSPLPTNRSFGLLFAAVFAVLGLWPPLAHGQAPNPWALGSSTVFLVTTILRPQLLTPLNWLWYQLGQLLHHIVNPLLMALIYFGAVLPMGVAMRLGKRDALRLRLDPGASSYWIRRESPGARSGSMTKQF